MPYLKKATKERIKNYNKQERQKIYTSAKWLKIRQAKLISNPLCELCLAKGIIKPAIDIHHKDSFMNYEGVKRLQKAYDYSNLLSPRTPRHSALHKQGTTKG